MSFLKDEGGNLQIDNSVLFLVAIVMIGGMGAGALYLQQIELSQFIAGGLIGFIGGGAVVKISGSA